MKIENLNVEKALQNGWSEWKKYDKNRLYFDVKKSDMIDVDYYKSGNISSSHFDDEKISHAEAYRLLASKVFIDLDTMELHVQSDADEDLIDQLVKHEVEKVVEPEETAESTEKGEEKVLSFEKIVDEPEEKECEIRVISGSDNWEGVLKFVKDKESWVFYPYDDQAEPMDYENDNLEEVKEDIELEYEGLLKEQVEEKEAEEEKEKERDEFLKSLED